MTGHPLQTPGILYHHGDPITHTHTNLAVGRIRIPASTPLKRLILVLLDVRKTGENGDRFEVNGGVMRSPKAPKSLRFVSLFQGRDSLFYFVVHTIYPTVGTSYPRALPLSTPVCHSQWACPFNTPTVSPGYGLIQLFTCLTLMEICPM